MTELIIELSLNVAMTLYFRFQRQTFPVQTDRFKMSWKDCRMFHRDIEEKMTVEDVKLIHDR